MMGFFFRSAIFLSRRIGRRAVSGMEPKRTLRQYLVRQWRDIEFQIAIRCFWLRQWRFGDRTIFLFISNRFSEKIFETTSATISDRHRILAFKEVHLKIFSTISQGSSEADRKPTVQQICSNGFMESLTLCN